MKKSIVRHIHLLVLLSAALGACRKDAFTPVNPSTLNFDSTTTNTALDQWLKSNFLDEYNVNVIYKYGAYYHDPDRNVTPPDPVNVQPMMTTVLDGYITPYRDVAGVDFIKKTVPKEFVLFGSTSYDAQNVGYAGTASGGVRINLFGVDNFSLTPSFVTGRLGVIHHEFTHIINQIYPIPTDFSSITAAYYNANWTATPTDTSHKYGFVSSYASQNIMEDYAETNRALLVSGQSWFDYWVKTSTAGAAALKAKEDNIVTYYSSIGIDYSALQKEIQLYIQNTLKDPSVTYPYWLSRVLYPNLTVNLEDNMYTSYGISDAFSQVYNQFKAGVLAYSSTQKYHLDSLQLRFTSNTRMTVRMYFTGANNVQYNGDFDFSVVINATTGEVTFAKIANATGVTYSNGALFASYFAVVQNYLTANTFAGSFMPVNAPAGMYYKWAGFTSKNDASNYFYGTLL